MTARVGLVPGVLALLPEYASIEDPVAELREACLATVASLGERVRVVASTASGERVGAALVADCDGVVDEAADSVLIVGNGSAKRTDKAPGHLDERAEAFDAALREALVSPDPAALRAVDRDLADELWADVDALGVLADVLADVPEGATGEVLFDAAPYGVQYWVIRWR